MEKKKTSKKTISDKPKKKAEAEKKPKKTVKAKKSDELEKLGVRRQAAETRKTQEKDSIAPPTEHLVDAFARLRTSSAQRQAPSITRLSAGSSLAPKPPVPPIPKPPAPAPGKPTAASAPAATPAASAAAPAAAPPKPATLAPKPVSAPPAAAPTVPPPPPPARPAAPPPAVSKPAQKPAAPAPPKPIQAPKPAAAPPPAPVPSKPAEPAPKPSLTPLKVTTQATVRELAEKMNAKVNDLIKKLMQMGVFATINQRLDSETAVLIAHDMGFDLEVVPMHMEEELAGGKEQADKPENLKPRPPVVTIMGHVDHGKTSLLDAIRSTNVAGGEAGGITQHIGAYKVSIPKGDIVFLDTPGHEAFTAMRARGAKATDIVVLVVSAADGVMPQTVEAIDHAKAAGVPIVIAVNKVDLPTANPQKIRQELSAHGLLSEEWGGKHIFVDVSAKKRINLDKLLEMLLLQSEVMELKANPDRPGVGVILEAKLDPKKGNVATLLVQSGTVKVGDSFVAGLTYGKVKAMVTDKGERLQKAGPSTPVELLGISGGVPQAGDLFNVVSSERQAREIAEKRGLVHREEALAHRKHMSLVGLKAQAGGKGGKTLSIVLKADTQGSIQAIKDSLEKLSNAEILVSVIHAGTGNLNESDVLLANASDAVILLFHADADARTEELAARAGVEVRKYEIIYDLVADVKAAMEGLLEPEIVETVAGRAEIREVFNVRGGKIAGCMVTEGKLTRGGVVHLFRGAQKLTESRVETLKRFKDDVKEVEKGLDCGVGLEGSIDFQKGDRLDVIVKEKKTRRLEAAK